MQQENKTNLETDVDFFIPTISEELSWEYERGFINEAEIEDLYDRGEIDEDIKNIILKKYD